MSDEVPTDQVYEKSERRLLIPAEVVLRLRTEASEKRPNEACGLLAGTGEKVLDFHALSNADASPDHFSMIPEEQFAAVKKMRTAGHDMLAIWHSHPDTPARMSKEDLRLAFMPGVVHVILSLAVPEEQSLRGFEVVDGTPREIEIHF